MVNPSPREVGTPAPRGQKTEAGKRVLFAIACWTAALLIVPAVLMNFVHRVQLRQRADRMPRAGEVTAPVVPLWIPLRADFRVAGSRNENGRGTAALQTGDAIDVVKDFYVREFQRSGFTVGTNLMQQDGQTAGVLLNSANGGRSAVVTLRADGTGTKIDLTYSEKN